jgi:MraZ protein
MIRNGGDLMQGKPKMHFKGEYFHSIDSNNRVILPAKFKDSLYGEAFVIYHKPSEQCLRLYVKSEWDDMITEIAFVDDGVDRTKIQRHFSLNSKEYELDAQGRFVLPQKFVDAVGLKKEIVTLGIGPRAEIWDKETYEAVVSSNDNDVDVPLPI